MSGRFWLISILTLMAVVLVGFRVILPKLTGKKPTENWQRMRVGVSDFRVLIADSPTEMEQGLGGRAALAVDEGMLFVYPQPVTPRYWMKGMRFDLDLIWIREGKVVDISPNVQAPTNDTTDLPFYIPKEPVDSVLEVIAGAAHPP